MNSYRWWPLVLTVGVFALMLGQDLGAGEGKPENGQAAFNKGVQDGLVKALRVGVDLYNNKRDYGGCYRVYQGSLLAVRPLLAQSPELQQVIDAGFAKANGMPLMWQRAHALREVIDVIYRR